MQNQNITPIKPDAAGFNPLASIPYGCTVTHIQQAMTEFVDFLSFINQQLATREIGRLETLMMPANFSSMVGEFIAATLPKYCSTLVKNRFHNGHPDLIPADTFPNNRIQYSQQGIEIKASRYLRGWQGHNPEDAWLMVFAFESNRSSDDATPEETATSPFVPTPFQFLLVAGAQLEKSDWKFSGRSETSRRTITASVAETGYQKMMENWIYKAPSTK
jgi:hypothetical protein